MCLGLLSCHVMISSHQCTMASPPIAPEYVTPAGPSTPAPVPTPSEQHERLNTLDIPATRKCLQPLGGSVSRSSSNVPKTSRVLAAHSTVLTRTRWSGQPTHNGGASISSSMHEMGPVVAVVRVVTSVFQGNRHRR